MLKRAITYEDFNGETVTEEFYFNISKPELVELEVEYEEGFSSWLEKIIESQDRKVLIKQFKDIVLLAYGQKSADGKSFIKNEEMREAFSQTAAYQTLFMELALDDGAAANFIIGIMPKDLQAQAQASIPDKPTGPPSPPVPPKL